METRYDYIIAGGGCAGLSLAYYLSQSDLAGRQVLIIDRDQKDRNDRTWCFWTKDPTPFEAIVHRRWSKLAFADRHGSLSHDLGKREYQLIRSIDFYRFVDRQIDQVPNIHRLQGSVTALQEDENGPYALVEGRRYYGTWVFNSCFRQPAKDHPVRSYHRLKQHFTGWVIETTAPAFKPDEVMLMDFRTPQQGNARFFYILPFSEREALVEYTIFSPEILPQETYGEQLQRYIRAQLGIREFTIKEKEFGVIPMTDAPFSDRWSSRIINIGISGGAAKPTTGYAFLNIQRQTQAIVQRLLQGETPVARLTSQGRFRFYDTLLLHILEKEGQQAAGVFSALFRHNRMDHILTFLEERSGLWQEALLFARLPIPLFLRALWETKLARKNDPVKHPASLSTQNGYK